MSDNLKSAFDHLIDSAKQYYPQATQEDIQHMLDAYALSMKMFKSDAIAFGVAMATLKNKFAPSPAIEVQPIDININRKLSTAFALRMESRK